MTMPRRTLLLLALAAPLASPIARAQDAIETKNDLTYREVDGRALKLDLAYPSGDGPYPGLVVIHGGGWKGGDKASNRAILAQAARMGYVAISPQYRFAPDSPFPAQVHDVKAAVRWLKAHAKDYHLDPDRVGAMGFSAGGHLSLMLGVTDADDGLEGDPKDGEPDTRIRAVVNYFGPTDLGASDIPDAVQNILRDLLGGAPSEKPELTKQASPLTFVTKDDPPILTFQGTKDPLVPATQALVLGEAMTKEGIPGRVELLIGRGHGNDWGPDMERSMQQAMMFLDRYLKGK
jgi:acetyl esterase/lipase